MMQYYWWKDKYYSVSLFPLKFRLKKQTQGFKNFLEGKFLYISSISLQPLPKNENKKFQKLYFNFTSTYGKLLQLAGWFTPL